jgi:rRNA biogenesis protein RRP5
VDLEKRRISFSLKPSHFKDDEDTEDSADDSDDGGKPGFETLGVVEEDVEMLEVDAQRSEEGEDDTLDADEIIPVDPAVDVIPFGQPSIAVDSSVPTLNVKHGIQWSHDTPHTDESDASSDATSDSDTENRGSKKKKRKRKEIEQDLTADLHTKTPESNADFERLLLGSPNSSYLWIRYMSFQLQLSEVDKAREIAHRALKVISFREEQEKLNVWISLLNLENVYGTNDSLEATFKDAARHNDAKTIYLRLAAIFQQSEKYEVRISGRLQNASS